MTAAQEVLLMQLLQKIADQGNHTAMDQLTLQVLQKISDRLDTLVDLLALVHGKVGRLEWGVPPPQNEAVLTGIP